MTISELAQSYDPLGEHLADPYPFYATARRREPVFYSPRLDAWVVTRFRDVDAVLRDSATFSSVNSLRPIRPLYPATLAALADGYPPAPDHITSDGPAHHRLRVPYTRHLTAPGRVKTLEPEIRARATTLLDALDTGAADLVAGYTAPLPLGTAAGLFGLAPSDVEIARAGSESLFRLGSADLSPDEEAAAARTAVAFHRMMAGYVRSRRAAPTGDLISDVVAALAPGAEPLTFGQEAEVVGTLSSTFGAAHITTTDLIGNAIRLLLDHPDQWRLLRRNPDLIPHAVEEALRCEAPVPTIFRYATRPVTLSGVDVPQGAHVLLIFASANRDEDRFPDAECFDVTRTPSRHFGFGAGVHTCAGAGPARAQARIALGLLAERLPDPRRDPDHDIPLRRSINVRGPLSLYVRR
ncbi:cytochrome P450 [Catenuloplanes atrovinosus]|uniref:Cytochrome P450 n=1 Tax=Catenuloplanes atrovinosus TaxID=137266 RepID=A0AAE3YJR6_9ACTN|nr:cytochrome P450 [Catenuloplanes atrovinosus]MDR7275123.1 cytochrome P450 [Catenuloplanes atrovinosus]